MADLRDEHGNPIQLTDEQGNPVHLTDEFGNPVYVTGVATKHPVMSPSGLMGYNAGSSVADQPQQQLHRQQLQSHFDVSGGEKIQRSNSSSSSSSEDDGMGGRRKKVLKEKIKETLTRGKNKEEDQYETRTQAVRPTVPTTASTAMAGQQHHRPTVPTTASTCMAGQQHHVEQHHEKKSVMEKIKEKLPGHHAHK